MEQIAVSIIVPVYNTQAYLNKCVDSILSQTFQNFELILVDDGSTDDSSAICDCYQRQDSRVHVVHKENCGPCVARNTGLELAQGKYIYFVDSDDYIESNLLEKIVPLMEEQHLDCACFGMIKETTEGEPLEEIYYKPKILYVSTEEERLEFLLKYLLNYKIGWEAWNRIYRAEIIQKNQLRFVSDRLIFAEDMLFNFLFWLHAGSCLVVHDLLYHYVQHGNSLMDTSKDRNVIPETYEVSRHAYAYLCQRNFPLIVEHFVMIHLHLLEWQTRSYVLDKGIKWIKQELSKLDHSFFLPEGVSLEQAYQNSLCYCGRWDGFVTVAIPVPDDHSWEKAKTYIRHLQEQTLQKMDILLLVREKKVLEEKDLRLRQIYMDDFIPDSLVRTAFRESYGEYLYFADLDEHKQNTFLCCGCDALKYNDCGTVIFTAGQAEFFDKFSVERRYHFRNSLKRNRFPQHTAIVRADLLEESGLLTLVDLRKYIVDVILSGHVVLQENIF